MEITKGEYYYNEWTYGSLSCSSIVLIEEKASVGSGYIVKVVYMHRKKFNRSKNKYIGGLFNKDSSRLATNEEKQWLSACITANKYMSKKKL